MQAFQNDVSEIWDLLERVKDPEIPVISLRELGILRDIEWSNERLIVTITPTYSGCPAMDVIRDDITQLLSRSGYVDIEIKTALSPAWTTEWMTNEGKAKLQAFGIAPPEKFGHCTKTILCPKCRSNNIQLISEYDSTACQSMYQCNNCQDPFCYFKAI